MAQSTGCTQHGQPMAMSTRATYGNVIIFTQSIPPSLHPYLPTYVPTYMYLPTYLPTFLPACLPAS